MKSPERVDVSANQVVVDTVEQFYITVDHSRKLPTLARLLFCERPRQAIVFCRTKRGTEKIFKRLSKLTKSVSCLNGDMEQSKRDRVMSGFRAGETRVLTAGSLFGMSAVTTAKTPSRPVNRRRPGHGDTRSNKPGRLGLLTLAERQPGG